MAWLSKHRTYIGIGGGSLSCNLWRISFTGILFPLLGSKIPHPPCDIKHTNSKQQSTATVSMESSTCSRPLSPVQPLISTPIRVNPLVCRACFRLLASSTAPGLFDVLKKTRAHILQFFWLRGMMYCSLRSRFLIVLQDFFLFGIRKVFQKCL